MAVLGPWSLGGVNQERLQLNEESVWCMKGNYQDRQGAAYLPRIRELLFAGKYREAEQLASRELMAERLPTGTRAYQTLGDLHINYYDSSQHTNYRRSLHLDSALVRVQYTRGSTSFIREVFSSAVDDMIVFRETTDGDGKINCELVVSRPGQGEEINMSGDRIIMKQHVENGQGVRYETRIQVLAPGGSIEAGNNALIVKDARQVEIRIVAGTDYAGENPETLCNTYESKVGRKSYE